MIYFDNSATTKPYPEALETYMQVLQKIVGNRLVSIVWEIRQHEF